MATCISTPTAPSMPSPVRRVTTVTVWWVSATPALGTTKRLADGLETRRVQVSDKHHGSHSSVAVTNEVRSHFGHALELLV